jgi:ABC-type nitrate/sulfonate/bicarbonate transport system permease component
MTLWRIASIALFCGAWELAGQLRFNYAFPTFSATVAAFFEMVGFCHHWWRRARTSRPDCSDSPPR